MALLEARGLAASYGRARVLFGVDLDVEPGEVLVLLGRNGAGKSTTLKSIMGLLRPRAGEVRFGGRRIDGLQPFEIARLGLGYVPEDRRVFPELSVAENLEAGRKPGPPGAPQWSERRVFELFPALEPLARRPAGRLSGGEQQMLAIARTLMGSPSALLLDEPAEGLAPRVVADVARAIAELKRAGLAVLLCEQNLAFARRVGDRGCLLERGEVLRSGPLSEFEEALAP